MSIRIVWQTDQERSQRNELLDVADRVIAKLVLKFGETVWVTRLLKSDGTNEKLVSIGIPNKTSTFYVPAYISNGAFREAILEMVDWNQPRGMKEVNGALAQSTMQSLFNGVYNVSVRARYRKGATTLYHLLLEETRGTTIACLRKQIKMDEAHWRHPDTRMEGLGIIIEDPAAS